MGSLISGPTGDPVGEQIVRPPDSERIYGHFSALQTAMVTVA